jgi:probable phosphoglycerate mutase
MTLLLLARHGQTDWNRDGIWQGQADPPLNALGRRQARELAARLRHARLDALYASDLRRALETAEAVARAVGLPVIADPGLREMDVGAWTGLTWAEIAERFPNGDGHGGESAQAFQARVLAAVQRIAAAHPQGTVLVVAHGGTVRVVQRCALGEALPVIENGSVYPVRVQDGRFYPVD